MVRPTSPPPGAIRAQLNGHAQPLIRNKIAAERCIAEIHEITRDPVLLGQASGRAHRAWQHNPVTYRDGDKVSRMLDAAGADQGRPSMGCRAGPLVLKMRVQHHDVTPNLMSAETAPVTSGGFSERDAPQSTS